MVDHEVRHALLLAAASRLLLERGYDKTSMSEVADAAGLSRTIVYRHFSSKADLVDALLTRTLRGYLAKWRQAIADDPSPGTVPSIYRATIRTIVADQLLIAIYTRDEKVWGRYLQRNQNRLPRPGQDSTTHAFLTTMQRAGTVREGVDLAAVTVVMDSITPALLRHLEQPPAGGRPDLAALLNAVTEMLEGMLTPAEPDSDAALRAIDALVTEASAAVTETDQTATGT